MHVVQNSSVPLIANTQEILCSRSTHDSSVLNYIDNLESAKKFYLEKLGLEISDEQVGHHAKLDSGASFVCLERKGAESYPSKDKAVLFFEVPDLEWAIAAIGQDQVVQPEHAWAVLHDPEGHNVILLQRSAAQPN